MSDYLASSEKYLPDGETCLLGKGNHTVNLLLGILLFGSFLSIFYFFYVVRVEKKIFITQIEKVVDEMIPLKLPLLPPETIAKIKAEIVSSSSYPEIEAKNAKLLDQTKSMVLKGAALVAGIIILLKLIGSCMNLKVDLLENLILLAGVALVEFTFISLIPTHYTIASADVIQRMVLEKISAYCGGKIAELQK